VGYALFFMGCHDVLASLCCLAIPLLSCHLFAVLPSDPAIHCSTLQHTATRCNALQRAATRCNALQRAATRCNALQRTAMHWSKVQHVVSSLRCIAL